MDQSNAKDYTDPSTLDVDPNFQPLQTLIGYNPGKKERNVRRQVYIRFYQMRDNDWRTAAEHQWQIADNEYNMNFEDSLKTHVLDKNGNLIQPVYISDPDDKRSKLKLPDSFAAIQSHMQETITRRSRPVLNATESSDEPIEEFTNTILNYSMDSTNYDYQWSQSGLAAAIRGTSFLYDYYRLDRRWVKDIDDVDEQGNIKYKKKLLTDFDDDFTEWIPNEYMYVDEKARHIDQAVDCVRREIINIREFQRIYGQKKDFFNVEFVRRGGDTGTRSIFKLPKDITGNDVEVLHYYNRGLDVYWVVANNIVVRNGPLPFKHKELPIAVRYYYRVPGQFWGMGIPQVIHMLAEERTSIRNLLVDRQNLQVNKMFLHNNMFDLAEEDLVSRPHGLISVDTNGQPLKDVLVPIEYGDVPSSAFKVDQMQVDDMKRATGIDTTLEAQPSATATEAALNKENFLKRINMISVLDEMDTVLRIGRLKWSNIQFFYPLGRMDTIFEENEERQEQVLKTITSNGRRFRIQRENGQAVLKMEDIKGSSSFMLDKKMAKYMEGSFDVVVDATQFTPTSRVIQQTKVTEMFSLMVSNPAILGILDVPKAVGRLLTINDEKPKDWLQGFDQDPGATMLAAETENRVMAAGQPLAPTPGATADHTLVHLMFTESEQFKGLPDHVHQIFAQHIMGEHNGNPATGSAQEAMSANGLGGPDQGAAQGAPPDMQATPNAFIGQLPNLPALGLTSNTNQPQAQMADLESTNFSKPSRTGV